ncbi:hypothetical protein GQ53DRAFT_801909 [Thozetella sp. PMI_491]|nr:hypothetical protein GQ53DRAFT_801909 [Thozetella sp. PMI_491]
MKTSNVVVTTLQACMLFATTGSAYWVRGAAEMAMYFLAYTLEDIHFDQNAYDGWKIAPDCKGDRKGLWGQKGRCNLAQFMDHIWAQTKTDIKDAEGNVIETKYDSKPDASKIKWTATMKGVTDPETIISLIMGAKYQDGSMVCRKDTIPKAYGYTGNVDATKFFAADGADYFGNLQKFGPRVVQLKADLEGAKSKGEILTGDPSSSKYKSQLKTYEKFNTLYDLTRTAASIIVDLRKQDSWRHIVDLTNWKEKLGIEKPGTKPITPSNSMVGKYEEIDRDLTIDKMVENGQSKADATTKYDKWWNELQESISYKGHQAAIFGAEQTLKALEVGPTGACG